MFESDEPQFALKWLRKVIRIDLFTKARDEVACNIVKKIPMF